MVSSSLVTRPVEQRGRREDRSRLGQSNVSPSILLGSNHRISIETGALDAPVAFRFMTERGPWWLRLGVPTRGSCISYRTGWVLVASRIDQSMAMPRYAERRFSIRERASQQPDPRHPQRIALINGKTPLRDVKRAEHPVRRALRGLIQRRTSVRAARAQALRPTERPRIAGSLVCAFMLGDGGVPRAATREGSLLLRQLTVLRPDTGWASWSPRGH